MKRSKLMTIRLMCINVYTTHHQRYDQFNCPIESANVNMVWTDDVVYACIRLRLHCVPCVHSFDGGKFIKASFSCSITSNLISTCTASKCIEYLPNSIWYAARAIKNVTTISVYSQWKCRINVDRDNFDHRCNIIRRFFFFISKLVADGAVQFEYHWFEHYRSD